MSAATLRLAAMAASAGARGSYLARLLPLLATRAPVLRPRWAPGPHHAAPLWGQCGGHGVRFKSSSRRRSASRTRGTDSGSDSEEEPDPDSDLDPDPDPTAPEGSKDVEKHVPSFRYDLIMKAGLDLSRNKVEGCFYDGRLRLNGQRLLKQSRKVKVGDTLDLVLDEDGETGTVRLKRVVLRKVLWASPEEDRFKVLLRRWKDLDLSAEEAWKMDP